MGFGLRGQKRVQYDLATKQQRWCAQEVYRLFHVHNHSMKLELLFFFFFLNMIRVQPFCELLVMPAALEWREEEAASLVSHTAEFLGLGCRQAVHGNLAIASR